MILTKNTTAVKINKSQLMKAAWQLIRKHKVATFAEALRKAWQAYKLKAQMTLGVVKFAFRKTNGEIRNAVGTLAKNLYQYEPKGTGRASHPSTIAYWDLEKNSFRSFCIETLL